MPRFPHHLLTTCLALTLFHAATAAAADRPLNLLVIETDEHHFKTLGCYGGKIVGTPHIDWVAETGAMCTSFYATTPVCSPSRASLVSGLYPQKTPVTTNNIPLDDSIITFAEVLRRNGYATGYAGKWHLDGTGKPQWQPERKFGFTDNRFMFNRGHWKKLIDTPDGPRVGSRDKRGQPGYALDGADEKTFTTDWLCDKAVDFIETHRAKPFCYVVNLPDPHGPNTVRPPYDTMYADVEVPIPASLNRAPGQIPAWGKPAGVKPEQLRKLMRNYYGMVKCIDDNVGKLIKTLRQHDLLDHTIIVFTSDHGDLCGEHGRLNKGVPYEGSARIPFLMRSPGQIPPGTVVHQALSNVDFFPTVLSLMQVEYNHPVDGRDATDLFTAAKSTTWEDIAFIRSTGRPGQTSAWISAITERYKLVYASNEEPWLIDLEQDPQELTNLFGRPEHREQIRWMTERLASYGQTHQDEYLGFAGIRPWIAQVLKD